MENRETYNKNPIDAVRGRISRERGGVFENEISMRTELDSLFLTSEAPR